MGRIDIQPPLRLGINPARVGATARECQCVNFPLADHADFQVGAKWRD
jgi:hypothetical protein